jgi:hypothetical protein
LGTRESFHRIFFPCDTHQFAPGPGGVSAAASAGRTRVRGRSNGLRKASSRRSLLQLTEADSLGEKLRLFSQFVGEFSLQPPCFSMESNRPILSESMESRAPHAANESPGDGSKRNCPEDHPPGGLSTISSPSPSMIPFGSSGSSSLVSM